MADELEAIAEIEQAQPAIEPGEPEQDALEQVGDDTQVDEPENEGGDDDLVDLDFAFGKHRVSKKLADAVTGLQKTFTEKTQAYNREIRDWQAKAEARAEANEAELKARAQLHYVNQELKRFEGFDWATYQAHRQQDPLGAQEAWDYKQHLTQQVAQLEGEIQQSQTQRSQEAQQEFAKRVEETREFAVKNIEGWSPEVDAKLLSFAQEMEIPEEFIRTNLSPVLYKILHRAWIGQQTLTRKPAAKQTPAAQPAPTARITSRGNPAASKSLADMDMDEYVAARRKQNAA